MNFTKHICASGKLSAGAHACTCAALLFFAGCAEPRNPSVSAPSEAIPQFSAKDGLSLPEETRRSLGLELAEVSEREMGSVISFDARVFHNERAVIRASGLAAVEQSKLLEIGQSVLLKSADGATLTGKLKRIDSQLRPATGLTELVVEIAGAAAPLRTGEFLHAAVTLDSGKPVMTVPKTALLRCSEGHFVYTVSGDHLVRTAVEVGRSNAEHVEIVDGLFAGDQVVARPVMSLWMMELAAVKGGQACCVKPKK